MWGWVGILARVHMRVVMRLHDSADVKTTLTLT